MEINNNTDGSSYPMPKLDVLEKDKTPQWYADVLRYYSTFYNKAYSSWDRTNNDTIYSYSPVEQMKLWFYYYLGRQPNLNFNHFFDSGTGTSVQNTWINGQKISQLIKRMEGNTNALLSDIEISTKALSKEAKNRRLQMKEDAMIEWDNATLFKNLEEQFGLKLKQVIPPKFKQSPEDIAKYVEYDFKEQGELYARMIAEWLFVSNDGKEEYKSAFRHAVVGGLCGMRHYVDNGAVKLQYVPSWNCIWDNRKEDDFNKKARFGGFVERLTPAEIEHRFKNGKIKKGLTDTEIEEIRSMARDNTSDNTMAFETSNNFKWFSSGGNTAGEVTCVTMYWLCLRDTRYKKTEDNYGNKVISKLNDNKSKNKKEPGDYMVMDICKATLIGNRYLVDFGYDNNIVRDPNNQSDPLLPIKFYIPDMVLDQFRSSVSKLHEIQDQLDALRFKLMETVSRDIGKNYIINGNKLGLVRPKDMLTDFKSMGIHVATGTDGEVDSLAATQRAIELVDMTLDPNVRTYIELMSYFETQMEEIVAIPKVALGQERSVGLGVQKGIMENASQSNVNLYDGFMHYLEMNMQYATNMQKNIYCIEGNEDAEMVVGERGLRYIKETKDLNFESFGVYITLKDIITPEKRQQMWDLAFNLSQNGMIDMKDAIAMQTETSLLKLQNYFDFSLDKKKKEAEATQKAQAEQQQAMMAQQQQGQLANTAMQQDGATDRSAMDNKTKLAVEAANVEAKNNSMQPQGEVPQ